MMGEPVVRRVGRVLVYPLRTIPLMAIVVFTLGIVLSLAGGLLGLPLLLLLTIWFIKYAFIALESTALGHAEPPVLSIEMVNPIDEPRPLLLLGVLMITAGVAQFLGDLFGGGARLAFLVPAVLLLPASFALLAIEHRLRPALDPLRMLRMVVSLRWRYGILCCALAACPVIIVLLAATVDSLPLLVAGSLYAVLLCAHAFGRVLFDNRDLIGLDVEVDPVRAEGRRETERWRRIDRMLDGVYHQARQGQLRAAYIALLKGLEDETLTPGDRLELHHRLTSWEETSIALALARDSAGELVRAGELRTAWLICVDCLRIDRHFRPADADAAFALARFALDHAEPDKALLLLEDFDLHYEGRGPVQAAALEAVRILVDRRGDEAAGRLIERVRARFGSEHLRPELAAYARLIGARESPPSAD